MGPFSECDDKLLFSLYAQDDLDVLFGLVPFVRVLAKPKASHRTLFYSPCTANKKPARPLSFAILKSSGRATDYRCTLIAKFRLNLPQRTYHKSFYHSPPIHILLFASSSNPITSQPSSVHLRDILQNIANPSKLSFLRFADPPSSDRPKGPKVASSPDPPLLRLRSYPGRCSFLR